MTSTIHYTIKPIDPYMHLFAVSCTIKNPNPQGQQFTMPSWAPGSYKIRDFSKQVSQVSAHSAGELIECHKINKNTWQCAPTSEPLTIDYQVYAWDLSVRASHLDQTHASITGSSVFMCPVGAENIPCVVDIQRPEGNQYKTWRVATALTRKELDYEFGYYHAQDFAELIDQPIELGNFVLSTFTEQGIPHELVFTDLAPNTDIERVTQDVQRICAYYLKFFPKPYPMKRYVFLIMLLEQGFGGLEHRSSCFLHFSKYGLPTKADRGISESYSSFLTLGSHEYMHTWLVKGIKPNAFFPYDLHQENYTELLWVFEGFTSYYEEIALVRNGLLNEKQFFTFFAQKIYRLWRTPGRNVQSVTEASYDAWIKLYQADENTANITISYYLKGSLIALILDIYLRELTENEVSLDTILLELWQRYARKEYGVPEDLLPQLVRELVGPALDGLLQEWLYTTNELPLQEALAKVGVLLQQRPAKNSADKGEAIYLLQETIGAVPTDLGIIYDSRQNAITIQQCLTNSSAHQAGLSAGDIIIAIDDLRVDPNTLSQHLSRYVPGDKIKVQAFRRDLLMTFHLTLEPAIPVPILLIQNENEMEAKTKLRRDMWLHSY
ncbi:MAG: M61 family metallopeptidase [Gammaproteobacteria bacterium]